MSVFHVVIPARYASERLPGKPLIDLGGKPMIVRCWDVASRAGADEVIVAADDPRILEVITEVGGTAMLTDTAHPNGTDRIAEVARRRGWSEDAIVVNMQGDEPELPPHRLTELAHALATSGADVATMATPIREAREVFEESVVKVVLDQRGFALYFSRAPIPWVRGGYASAARESETIAPSLRHIGLYAYRVRTLEALSQSPRADLEVSESLEQLRALYLGARIHVTVIEDAPPAGVDTQNDLHRVRRAFEAR